MNGGRVPLEKVRVVCANVPRQVSTHMCYLWPYLYRSLFAGHYGGLVIKDQLRSVKAIRNFFIESAHWADSI